MFHSGIDNVSVVPYAVWYSPSADRTASIHGALPWFGDDRGDWEKVNRGYTLRVLHKDGSVTYGLGRPPGSKADMEKLAANINARSTN